MMRRLHLHTSNFKKRLFPALLFLILALSFTPVAIAQHTFAVSWEDETYEIQFLAKEIAEVRNYHGNTIKDKQLPSHAVILSPQSGLNVQRQESKNGFSLDSGKLRVVVDTVNRTISYLHNGKTILTETGFEQQDDGYRLAFDISETEILMGGGARALGMDRRGHKLRLYNRAHYGYETKSELMNFTLPIVASSERYMVHFDNPSVGWLDLDSNNNDQIGYEAEYGPRRYQVIVGDSWPDILKNYTALTGTQPLPPRWAFGNFASRFGYHSQEEVLRTAQKFREENIPVDAIVLDLYWFGKTIKGTMGNLAFDRDSFPEPEKMIAQLKEQDIKTVLITEPFILTSADRWDEAVQKDILAKDSLGRPATYDFYFGNTGIVDVFEPAAEKWFWNKYKELYEMGVDGWWGDLGEPEVHPKWVQHHTGPANLVHNIYGHKWAELIYEGYQRNYPDERPFILMRAGYSGSQRLGMIPWTGDVNRTWGGLQPQTEIALQMGVQGIPYMHSDLGGFAGDLEDDELYIRWLQYGVFQPIFRPHAQEETASEPVFRSAFAKAKAKEAIELRYRLLPYIYTIAAQATDSGIPLMRPVFFEEPDNPEAYKISSSYLFGPDLLVAPVVKPGVQSKQVYLPAGSRWQSFPDGGEEHEGGQWIEVSVDMNAIPVFVRSGAIIPMVDVVQSTTDYQTEKIQLHYYPGSETKSRSTIYDDDGKTATSMQNLQFAYLDISAKKNNQRIKMQLERGAAKGLEDSFGFAEIIVHHANSMPEQIEIDGRNMNLEDIHFSTSEKTLTIPVTIEEETEITITF